MIRRLTVSAAGTLDRARREEVLVTTRSTGGRRAPLVWSWVLVAAVSCSSDGGLTMAEVAGTYRAASLTTDDGRGEVDRVASGSSIVLTLGADGSTKGMFAVPEGEDGEDLDAELVGSWALAGDRVTLWHEADTVLREITFEVEGDDLVGAYHGEPTVRVVLSRLR